MHCCLNTSLLMQEANFASLAGQQLTPTEARTSQPAAEAVPASGQEEQSTAAGHAAQASASQVHCVAAESTSNRTCLRQLACIAPKHPSIGNWVQNSTQISLHFQANETLSAAMILFCPARPAAIFPCMPLLCSRESCRFLCSYQYRKGARTCPVAC